MFLNDDCNFMFVTITELRREAAASGTTRCNLKDGVFLQNINAENTKEQQACRYFTKYLSRVA